MEGTNPYEFTNKNDRAAMRSQINNSMNINEAIKGRFYGKERQRQQENMADLLNDQYGRDFREAIRKQEHRRRIELQVKKSTKHLNRRANLKSYIERQ